MIYLTTADQDTVHWLHSRAQWFLWDQRQRGNDGWFTVEDIAAAFPERPPLIPLLHALRDFAKTGNLERDGEDRMRHVPTAGDGVIGDVVGINAGAVG